MKVQRVYQAGILISVLLMFTACGSGSTSTTTDDETTDTTTATVVTIPTTGGTTTTGDTTTGSTTGTATTTGDTTTGSTTGGTATTGGSTQDNTYDKSAYLIDSAVSGVSYQSDNKSGKTDTNGKFIYRSSDKKVIFRIGGVILGEFYFKNLKDDTKIYASELLGFSRDESNDQKLVKLLRFLQSMDSDSNPQNGITITYGDAKKLAKSHLDFRNKDLKINDISDVLDSVSKNLISEKRAVANFEKTLNKEGYNKDTYPPLFVSKSSFSVDENLKSSIQIKVVDATDVTFSLSGDDKDEFTLSKDGVLRFKKAPDYETKKLYKIVVNAKDAFDKKTSQSIRIDINDIQEDVLEVPTLVVVMNWRDYSENDASLWHDKFFNLNKNSVNRWFHETMQNRVNIKPVKETSGTNNDGIVMVDMGKNHPGGNDNKKFRDVEIFNAIKSDEVVNNVDFKQYDKDSNGIINQKEMQIIFIVAGGEMAHGDPVDHSIWAHSWSFNSNADTKVDGVYVMRYSSNLSKKGTFARFGSNHGGHKATIGVIAHEMGHALFNLKDYYDMDGGSAGLGRYDIMSGGSWAKKPSDEHKGATPTQYSTYNKIDTKINMDTIEVDGSKTITIKCSSSQSAKLNTNIQNEYFLLECRDTQKHNSDEAFESYDNRFSQNQLFGVLYHVDDDKPNNNEDGRQTQENHYKVAVVEQDTDRLMTDDSKEKMNFDDVWLVGDTINTQKTKLYNNAKTGYSIEVVSANKDTREMKFKITKN